MRKEMRKMKKMLIGVVILGLSMLLTSEKNLSNCKRWIGIESQSSVESYYSRISNHYYGTTEFWGELSLINRGVVDKPINELIVPSLQSIDRLKTKRTMIVSQFAHNAGF